MNKPPNTPNLAADLLTTAQVAAILGVSPRRVRAIIQARRVEPALIVAQVHLWTSAQVEELRPGPSGIHRGRSVETPPTNKPAGKKSPAKKPTPSRPAKKPSKKKPAR